MIDPYTSLPRLKISLYDEISKVTRKRKEYEYLSALESLLDLRDYRRVKEELVWYRNYQLMQDISLVVTRSAQAGGDPL